MKILTLTMNPTIDATTSIEKVVPEKKLRCETPSREPGGGGINVSRAIKKLGGIAPAMFPAGGTNGELLSELLSNEDITTQAVAIENMTRENLTVSEISGDQQFRFVMPGPEIAESEWQSCLDEIMNLKSSPEYIVASGSLPRGVPDDFYARLAKLGREIDSRIVVDTSGEPLKKAVEEGVYLIKPNIRELKDLIGEDVEDEEKMKQAAIKLCGEECVMNIVISLGAGGALLVSGDTGRHFRAPTVPIKSKVGAGDSMTAGIVLKLSEGRSTEEAIQYGIAAGAAAVMTPGTELCRKEDTDRLFSQIKSDKTNH